MVHIGAVHTRLVLEIYRTRNNNNNTMPRYKLMYFDTTGAGEAIRFLLSYGGQEFEDVRYSVSEWPKIKNTTPYGCLPLLEIDGKVYCQSLAIGRYLAKRYNLIGSTDEEELEINAIVETINDFRMPISFFFWEDDAKAKAEKEIIMREKLSFFLTKFEALVKSNGGHFHGNKVTWPDLLFTSLLSYVDFIVGYESLKDYPNLKELTKNILAIPNIKAWVDKRPTTCCLRERVEKLAKK